MSSTPTADGHKAEKGTLQRLGPVQMLVIVLLAIVVLGTAIAVVDTTGGATQYACMSISHSGDTVALTTTGLLHYLNSEYYISCNEGSSLPTGFTTTACLTISPQTIPAPIGVGAATEYYYISTNGGQQLVLKGAPALASGGEIIDMSGVSLSVTC